MGNMILVIGDPGTGKSTAIEGLDPKSTVIIKPNNKQLPFRGSSKLYNEELGNKIAFTNAKDKIWALEGYLLKQKLYELE